MSDYFTPPKAIQDSLELRTAYSLGIRVAAQYLRREEGSDTWSDNLQADFSSAWALEHRYTDEEQS